MKISFIIPVYNSERHIKSCINSIINQNIATEHYEIIVINDGSTDNSLSILTKLAITNSNLRIINQSNAGVSVARNVGIANAEGDYIIFVDSDDFIGAGSIDKIYDELISKSDVEILIARSFNNNSTECYPWKNCFINTIRYNGYDLFTKKYFRGSCCGVVYSTRFLKKNNVTFPMGVKIGEDTIFFSMCQLYVNNLYFTDIDLYYIIENRNSVSRSTSNIDVIKSNSKSLLFFENLYKISKLNKKQQDIVELCKYSIIMSLVRQAASISLNPVDFYNITQINSFLPIKLKEFSFRGLKIYLINKHFNLSYLIFRIKNLLNLSRKS